MLRHCIVCLSCLACESDAVVGHVLLQPEFIAKNTIFLGSISVAPMLI